MRKAFYFLLVLELQLALIAGGCSANGVAIRPQGLLNPAVAIISAYEKPSPEGEFTLSPYMANMFAIDMLDKDGMTPEIERYIEWVFAHLNYPDKYGMSGTIYDYEFDGAGNQINLKSQDSVDSYSATFLMLLDAYIAKGGKTEIVERSRDRILDIAYTMAYLQDKDGLTWALPDKAAKYLMDNCEVVGGLRAFLNLDKRFGWRNGEYYQNVLDGVIRGINSVLFDSVNGNYFWSIESNGEKHKSDWNQFYPDAFAQLFPVLFEIPGQTKAARQRLWDRFNETQKDAISDAPPEQRLICRKVKALMEKK